MEHISWIWIKKPKPFPGESKEEYYKRYRVWESYKNMKNKKLF